MENSLKLAQTPTELSTAILMSRRLNMTQSTKRQARIKWLLKHQMLWQEFPENKIPITKDHSRDFWTYRWKEIVEGMRKSRLIAPTTNWMDVNLNNLIKKAREEKKN
jgi:hypothetical protein